MLKYIFWRALSTIPIMSVVAVFVFSLLYISPGDPASMIAGDHASIDEIERIRQSLGLDQPYLVRFGGWLWDILHGDLGNSLFSGMAVTDLILQRLEPTISLMMVSIAVSIIIAVPIGLLAAYYSGSIIDRIATGITVLGFSIPLFIVGYILAYIFGLKLKILPVQGYQSLADGFGGWLRHLILPSLSLGFVYIALIARITRATTLEILNQDFIRTARSKGLSEFAIVVHHALKNAAVPITTVIGLGIAMLIGGAVVTESVFSIPGVGRLTIDAILRRDYPIIQGVVLVFSVVYVIVNLLIDLSYPFFDPRIKY